MNKHTPNTVVELSVAEAGIRIHPAIKHIPQWSEEEEQFLALVSEMEDGVAPAPIRMTEDLQIVDCDSRERFRAARRAKLETIPANIVANEDAEIVAITTLVNRRHLTKSALAYLTFPMFEAALEASRQKRIENLKKGNVSRKSPLETIGNKVEDFAARFGIGRNLFFEAKKVHEIFARDEEYKDQMEPRLLAEMVGGEHEAKRPVGLGAVIAGYGGRTGTKDKPKPQSSQLDLFTGAVGSFFGRFDYWHQSDGGDRKAAKEIIFKEIDSVPVHHCEDMADLLSELAKELRARAKSKIPK